MGQEIERIGDMFEYLKMTNHVKLAWVPVRHDFQVGCLDVQAPLPSFCNGLGVQLDTDPGHSMLPNPLQKIASSTADLQQPVARVDVREPVIIFRFVVDVVRVNPLKLLVEKARAGNCGPEELEATPVALAELKLLDLAEFPRDIQSPNR